MLVQIFLEGHAPSRGRADYWHSYKLKLSK